MDLFSVSLNVNSKMRDVAVLHHVILALETPFPRVFRALLSLELNIDSVGNNSRADEALLEIGVDYPGRFGRGCPDRNRPGADFLHPRLK